MTNEDMPKAMSCLIEQQAQTAVKLDRLNALINVVERHLTDGRNAKS